MLKRLLITGANGNLGAVCRQRLKPLAETLRLSARKGLGAAADHEEIVYCDLGDKAAVAALVEGCDSIVHLGGQATEAPWETIRTANIDGMFNLYEAARNASVTPRIVFASSNHVVGYYSQMQRLDAGAVPKPDSLYGVSKVFGEALVSMYHDKFGIETACIRIGSCLPEPQDHRHLSTWLSHDDFVRLIERVFKVRRLGCPVIYGVSANAAAWWDNREVAYLGWRPQDDAEIYRAKIDAAMDQPPDDDLAVLYHGGAFCGEKIHES